MRTIIALATALLFAAPAMAQQAGSNSNSGAVSQSGVNIRYGNGHKQVGAAIAPGLIASGLSCQGSVSAGAGGSGWGLAFGMTKMDRDCNIRENAKMIGLMGEMGAAREVMCNVREVREAFAAVGRPCIRDRRQAIATGSVKRRGAIVTSSVKKVKYRDPYAIVRDRQ